MSPPSTFLKCIAKFECLHEAYGICSEKFQGDRHQSLPTPLFEVLHAGGMDMQSLRAGIRRLEIPVLPDIRVLSRTVLRG